jgi:twinkle protein
MISELTITNIKASMVTHEIVSSQISIKKKGVDYVALCPFHAEKTPSFTINPVMNKYKCFGCGKSGDGITFIMETLNLNYIDALKWIAKKNNIEIEEVGQRKTIVKPTERVEKLSKEFIDYFETKRGISNNTLLRFNVTETFEWMPKAKAEVKAICFNYYRDEKLINIKFRAANKDFKMAKDAELIFYNLDAIKNETEIYITEGEVDCMSLHEAGIYNVISVPNGGSVSVTQKLEYLDNCFQYFNNSTKIILFTDNDATGIKLRDELARRLGFHKSYLVQYPDGCKDANDILVKHGKDALVSIAKSATLYPLEGEAPMDEIYPIVSDYYINGYPVGCNTGISYEFDNLLTFMPGELTVITGIPGSGKSEFIDLIMTKISKLHNWDWGICSFECSPEIHTTKLIEKYTDKAFAFRKDASHRMNVEEFEYGVGMVDRYFHFMRLSKIGLTIEKIIEKAEEFVTRYGIKGFLFDPWNCIEPDTVGEDNTSQVLVRLNKLVAFADKFKVHVFLVAHPTKLQKDKKTGKYEIPTLYSISGSAHFYNRTFNGMSIYRDFETGIVDVYVQKVKHYWLGNLGFCSFKFDVNTRQYLPI